jgi:NAD(P)-dependent dehydrogenase (short-subunit alcohol dehydrogenase family)
MGDRLKEKVALVSGAGSSGPGWGNGKATVVLFAREGAKVLAADLNLDAPSKPSKPSKQRAASVRIAERLSQVAKDASCENAAFGLIGCGGTPH